MAGELFNLLAQTQIKHVPYKGGADNVRAALTGETEPVHVTLSIGL